VRANRAYELIVTRGGPEPSFLADPQRRDRIEVVSIDDGEVVLFWELPARAAGQLLRSLRTDLAGLDAAAFLARWEGHDGTRHEPPR
jgi:hypothetical protein